MHKTPETIVSGMENIRNPTIHIRNPGMVQIFSSAEGSRLFGENAGGYPRHHFTHAVLDVPAAEWPLQAVFAGEDENTTGCWRERENSDLFSLEYVTGGTFAFTQFGQRGECGPDDLFLVQPGADNRMECLTPRTLKRTICMAGTALIPLLDAFNLRDASILRNLRREEIGPLFDRLIDLIRRRPEHWETECSALCYRILLELSAYRRTRREVPGRLAELLGWLDRNYFRPVTAEDLAARCGVSQTTLFRMFRLHLEESPLEYVIRLRMKHARTLLLENDLPIKEIAERTGYGNALYFSSEFRRTCGMSPREFRRRNLRY